MGIEFRKFFQEEEVQILNSMLTSLKKILMEFRNEFGYLLFYFGLLLFTVIIVTKEKIIGVKTKIMKLFK